MTIHRGAPPARVHSRYARRVADLPWQGVTVWLELRARRFRCGNGLCTWVVFCEPLPSVVARYARRACRLAETLTEIAFVLGGRPGSRFAHELAMAVSRHTLLRAVCRAARAKCESLTVLGVDDWAKRKGHR